MPITKLEAKARDFIDANTAFEEELSNVIQDAAVVHALSVRHPIPGMPVVPRDASWRKDGKLAAIVFSLVIDKRAGVLITDQALAKLFGWDTGRLNRHAQERLRLTPIIVNSQAIEITCHLKESFGQELRQAEDLQASQAIEITCHLKESKRGQHRKYAISGYTLADAKAMLPAGDPLNLTDLLTRAFGVVIDTIDTNPYRKAQRELSMALEQATTEHNAADTEVNRWSQTYEALVVESREAEENQVAYETFAAKRVSVFRD